ncbi:MAG TPA: uroporphyrinogen decarboxylase family protein, partial [Hyphomicrobiaceae bacterium]|nr:uroporphyrinogen decarboxylase family protein [Hyphomicrobiaceae bacterium]
MSERRMLRVFAGQALTPPPIWLMRQAGRYLPEYRAIRARAGDFLELCYTPELAAEVTLQPVRRFDFDAAIVFADILVVPDELNQTVHFVEGEGPRLDAIRSAAELARLNPSATQPKFQRV